MKKLLTILGTIGLTATTSATIVSCTVKKAQTTFKDLSSITTATWKGNTFGNFVADDFEDKTIDGKQVATVKNKAKIAAYVGAGFNNYQKTYNKISSDETQIAVYKKSWYGTFSPCLKGELNSSKNGELFFQVIDSGNKKSAFLSFNFGAKPEQPFDFQNWFTGNPSTEITVDDTENTDDQLKTLSIKIVNDWRKIKTDKNDSNWPLTTNAINDFFNLLGEYLIQGGYVSNYSEPEPPINIKQQLKNAFNQNQEGQNDTRQTLFKEWRNINDLDKEPLTLKINSLDNQSSVVVTLKLNK